MAVEEEDNYNHEIGGTLAKGMSAYELSREKRIRENLERMQKMGILDLTRTIRTSSVVHKKPGSSASAAAAAKLRKEEGARRCGGLLRPTNLRRSSRLQNATPVTYSDILISGRAHKGTKREKVSNATVDKKIVLEQGPRPEVYTEADENLLGSTERSWELFVDGCGKDGRRIYDPFKGKTCHQCRQKTLGHRTECSRCGMVRGQFCGDCLYMRYGEHVLEALENQNWICPVCRGICNCSLCRQAKGWAPTGSLYRKISSMGFKSVAHYLMETRCSQLKLETNADSPALLMAKRSLPFSNSNCMDPPESSIGKIKHLDINHKEVDTSSLTTDGGSAHVLTNRTLNFFSDGNIVEAVTSPDHRKGDDEKSEYQGIVAASSSVSNDSGQVKKCGSYSEPEKDSIGGRLRLRKRSLCFLSNGNDAEPEQPLGYQKGSEEQNQCQHIVVTDISVTNNSKQVKNHDPCCEFNRKSIGGRLKLRKRSLCFPSDGNDSAEPEQPLGYQKGSEEQNQCQHIVVTDISVTNNSKQVKNHDPCCEFNRKSIGGRLKLRKRSLCFPSDGNDSAEPEQPLGYQKGSEEQNQCQHIVVTTISVTNNSKQVKNHDPCCELNRESIGGRLKLRKRSLCFPSDGNDSAEPEKALDRENGNDDHNEDFLIAVTDGSIANSSNKVEKRGYCCKPGEDSIGGRLRLRKNTMLWT